MLDVAIDKRLGGFHLRARLGVGRGEVLVLFGHSGSGKSLTLRAIAGLLTPDSGHIAIGETVVFDSEAGVNVPPQRRGLGMVVQQYALFPHLSVEQNVGFGLHDLNKTQRQLRVHELLEFLGIAALAKRRPSTISGGQAQRVALARALAHQPQLLLLDEPFSALDSAIRVTLRRELARLTRDLSLTVVFVTHDLREAYNLADHIAVFEGGAVLQLGTRDEVFNRPHSARVAALTEVRNTWRGVVSAVTPTGRTVALDGFTVEVDDIAVAVTGADPGHGPRVGPRAPAGAGFAVGTVVDVCIRPERILLLRPDHPRTEPPRDSQVTAELVDEVAHGASYTLFFRVPGLPQDIEVDLAAHPYDVLDVAHRRTWSLALPRQALHIMPVE